MVVRAIETTESRGRLYRRSGDRGRAAAVLRSGSTGSSSGSRSAAAPLPERSSTPCRPPPGDRPPEVADILFGPAPPDDLALIHLAQQLTDLEERVPPPMTDHPATAAPTPADHAPPSPDDVGAPHAGPAPRRGATASADAQRAALRAVRGEVAKAVVGQDAAVTGLLMALLCRGHVLLEGVPGWPRRCWCAASPRRSTSTPSGSSSPPT